MECQEQQNMQAQPTAPAGAAQLRPKTSLFGGSNLNDNLSRHGRSWGAIRWMGVVPVSFPKTAVASTALLYCPISLWSDLGSPICLCRWGLECTQQQIRC